MEFPAQKIFGLPYYNDWREMVMVNMIMMVILQRRTTGRMIIMMMMMITIMIMTLPNTWRRTVDGQKSL